MVSRTRLPRQDEFLTGKSIISIVWYRFLDRFFSDFDSKFDDLGDNEKIFYLNSKARLRADNTPAMYVELYNSGTDSWDIKETWT